MPDVASLIAELERAPLSTAAALIRSLEIGSQASFSRLVTSAGPKMVAVGRARARRYAAARDIRGLGTGIPLFRVESNGILGRIGTLRPFAPDHHYLEDAAKLPRWMRGRRGDGVFEDLPLFAADQRPQGFLGRRFGGSNPALRLPDDPSRWMDDDCVVALANAGEDSIGDLVLGEESARRLYAALATEPAIIAPAERSRAYPILAQAAIDGVTPGTSVGGAQPKFGAIVSGEPSPVRVLVKFSPSEYSAPARRWCDLLVCEHLALQALRRHGFPALESEILEGGARVFLQTARFDRVGMRGRRPVVTLAAMNREYVGTPTGSGQWTGAVERLQADRWLRPDTLAQVRELQTFGRFIANTDMHFGNLSFVPHDDGVLALAPVYDMLPMGYAPVAGELPTRDFIVPSPDPGHESVWFGSGKRAIEYWQAVARDERVSTPFRTLASDNAAAIERALSRFPQL